MTKKKQQEDFEQQLGELTLDLQRTRADFENYRKRVETEKQQAKESGKTQAVMKLLPIIDTIERAISHIPDDLKDNSWANGIATMSKNLDKLLADFDLKKIDIVVGKTEFNPEFHEAISMEEGEGDKETISEELQPGYLLSGNVVRHAMVRVKR